MAEVGKKERNDEHHIADIYIHSMAEAGKLFDDANRSKKFFFNPKRDQSDQGKLERRRNARKKNSKAY